MKRRLQAAVLFSILLAGGCSLNYQATEVEAPGAESIPDTVALGVTYRVVKDSHLSLQLEAARAETYNSRKQTALTGAHFVEYDSKGDLATDGKADSVIYHTDTENAEISGAVSVYSASEKGRVFTESLNWENKPKLLTAVDSNERVVVRKDDGSYIVGRGFTGDFRIKEVRFAGPVEGTYVYEEK